MSASPGGRAAVFLDRDGTIVKDPGYLRDPAQVIVLDGAGTAIARLNRAGLAVILVTNQSGISRGLITEAEYGSVAARLEHLLGTLGASLDATYYCPHAPERDGPCQCRKPGLLLFQRAATDLGIDLAASWWVGDRMSDIEPARALGGKGILVQTGEGSSHREAASAAGCVVTAELAGAVDHILSEAGGSSR